MRRIFPIVVLITLAVPRGAVAAPSLADKAAAQALFEDGLQLMGAKHYSEACPKLEESERLDPALGTRFRLAECDEALGRRASAWAGYLEVAELAKAAGQADREALARGRAAGLEPRIARMKIVVATPAVPGLEVTRGSAPIGRGQWGTGVPIDPGTYELSATAPGMHPWRGSVMIPDEGVTVNANVPALEPMLQDGPDVTSPVIPVAPHAPPSEDRTDVAGRTGGAYLIGIGGVGIITSVVLGVVAKVNYDGAGSHCGASSCDASGKSTTDDARSLANVATGVFIGGAAFSAAGVVLILTSPHRHDSTRAMSLQVGPSAAWIEGSF